MEPVGFTLGVIAFLEQAATVIKSLRSTLRNYGSNPDELDSIQILADALFRQLSQIEARFLQIAPSLTPPQLESLEYHIRTVNGHRDEVASALVGLHAAITYPAYAWGRANHIAHELERVHTALRSVERDAQDLHANLSTFEAVDQGTAVVLDAVSRLSLLILFLFTMGLITTHTPER